MSRVIIELAYILDWFLDRLFTNATIYELSNIRCRWPLNAIFDVRRALFTARHFQKCIQASMLIATIRSQVIHAQSASTTQLFSYFQGQSLSRK